jgi:thiosulfate/3-mercaptopyruvate sulfurtransferase
MMEITPTVSTDWLADHIGDADVVVVDASVHLPDTGRDARAEYLEGHIPGALFFDLSVIADPDNPLPRKAPPAQKFAEEMGRLGISEQTHVIAYDTLGLYSAARVWWLLNMYGHERVSVLDGGMVAWKANGGAVESGEETLPATDYPVRERGDRFASWQHVQGIIGDSGTQILDARTPGRFAGIEEDRYPGTRSGHIPGSLNLYWADLLDPETKTLLPTDEIDAKLKAAGIRDDGAETVLTCGSGLTACILALGMAKTGRTGWRVYDGSWDEWGRRDDLPMGVGAPGTPGS